MRVIEVPHYLLAFPPFLLRGVRMENFAPGEYRTDRSFALVSARLHDDVQFAGYNRFQTSEATLGKFPQLPELELVSSTNEHSYHEAQPMDVQTAIDGKFVAENGAIVEMHGDRSMFMSVPGVGTASFSTDGVITIIENGKPEKIVFPTRADNFRGHVVFRYPDNSGVSFGAFAVLPGSGGASFTAGGVLYSFAIAKDRQAPGGTYTGTFSAAPEN